MIGRPGESVWVFHAGALGDHVMIWPLVRGMARRGSSVTVVAAGEHARLCEAEVGRSLGAGATGRVAGVDAEQARFTRIWRGADAVGAEDVVEGVGTVLTFVAPPIGPHGQGWWAGAAAMFPGAAVIFVDRPDRAAGKEQRARLWDRAGVGEHGGVEPVSNPDGPILLYAGAGGGEKGLAPEQWGRIVQLMLADSTLGGSPIDLLLGRNEIEVGRDARGVEEAVRAHPRVRVCLCADARSLADRARLARLFIGCDTGPTHLAAQLGVPTIALFGPTDPAVWAPVGARVRVLAPDLPRPMAWVEPDLVVAGARAMLAA